jgi:hypothetical protein
MLFLNEQEYAFTQQILLSVYMYTGQISIQQKQISVANQEKSLLITHQIYTLPFKVASNSYWVIWHHERHCNLNL